MSILSGIEVSHELLARVTAEILEGPTAIDCLSTAFPRLQEGELIRLQGVADLVNRHRKLRLCSKFRADLEILRVLAAVQWAADSWRAWYLSLAMRNEPGGSSNDHPASSIIRKLALKHLMDQRCAVKYVKGQTTYLAAKALGQHSDELPIVYDSDGKTELPTAECGILGGGWVYQRCAWIMRHPVNDRHISGPERERRLATAQDILASKLGRPAVSEDFVVSTEADYREAMTDMRKRVIADADQASQAERRREEVKVRIKEICHHVFSGAQFIPEYQIPSLNASYENSRRWGGAFVGLMTDWAAETFGEDETVEPTESDFLDIPVPIYDVGVSVTERVPVKGLSYVQSFNLFIDRKVIKVIERGHIHVKPFGIKEPDKVRVITMEEAAVSYCCLSIQKFLHKRLKSFGPFTYIGQPLDEEGWEKHFGVPLKDDEEYQSGDFDGATNNINPELSSYTWDCICEETTGPTGLYDASVLYSGNLTSTVWHRIGRMDLVNHLFHFGDEAALQVWGQLMGSPVSFPILCIINLAASSVGIGMTCDEVFAERAPILVNGDDLAAICPRSRYPLWSAYVSASGLKPSLGKNYMSKLFCIMNSEGRLARVVTDPSGVSRVIWKQVTFLNQAILRGFEKKGMGAGQDLKPTMSWWQLGARAQELCYGAPSKVAKVWLKYFVAYHHDILAEVPAGVSWYAAQALGGVGLPHLEGIEAIPLDSLKYHTFVVAEQHNDTRLGQQLFSYPIRDDKSWIDKTLSDSEKYYARYFPSHQEETAQLISGKTGMPSPREKSDLGSALRLAFVLDKWVVEWTHLTPGQRIALCSGDSRIMETNGVKEYGVGIPNVDFPRAKARHLRAIFKARDLAKKRVDDCGTYGPWLDQPQTRLHCMAEIRVETWLCPTERVIDWPDILSLHLERFGLPNKPRTRRARHEQRVPSPSEQCRQIATTRSKVGQNAYLEENPCAVSWERSGEEVLIGLGADKEIEVWESVAPFTNTYSPTYSEIHWSTMINAISRFETSTTFQEDETLEALTKRRELFIVSGDRSVLRSTVRGTF